MFPYIGTHLSLVYFSINSEFSGVTKGVNHVIS